jgi:hypothetical protein
VRFRVPYVQTSDAVIPEAEVNVRLPFTQTSAASEPKVVSERAPEDQTASGIVAANEVDAVSTVALVLLLIVLTAELICEFVFALIDATIDDDAALSAVIVFTFTASAIGVVEAMTYPIWNVRSRFAKSPPAVLPQVIVVGQIPTAVSVDVV